MNRRTVALMSLVFALSTLAACGGDDAVPYDMHVGPGDAGRGDAGNSLDAGDAGTVIDAGSEPELDASSAVDAARPIFDFDAGPGTPVLQNALVSIARTAIDGGSPPSASASAQFAPVAAGDSERWTFDGCTVTRSNPLAPAPAYVNAGSVSVSSTAPVALDISIPRNPAGNYSVSGLSPSTWVAGATYTVTATGADVPAFTQAIRMPAHATLVTPVLVPAPGTRLTLDRSTPLILTWSGASSDDVELWILQASIDGAVVIDCIFPASAGSAEISTRVLSQFAPGPSPAILMFSAVAKTEVAVGDWNVNFNGRDLSASAGLDVL